MSREVLRAILKNDRKKLEEHIDGGANISEVTEKEGWSYLHNSLMMVAKFPDAEIIQYLIDCGVDVNAVDVHGNVPIHYAVRLSSASIVQVLISAGAYVNIVNHDGVSPLRQALLVKPFDCKIIKVLLGAGTDVEQKREGGVSIKDYVGKVVKDKKIADLFR